MNRANLAALPFALLLFAYAPRAFAQSAEPGRPPPTFEPRIMVPVVQPVPVSIQVEQGVSLDLVGANDVTITTLSDRCAGTCRSTLPPGEYTLRARSAATGELIGERTIDIDRPSHFRAFQPDSTAKGLGLAMAITGHVVSIIGTAIGAFGLLGGACEATFGCADGKSLILFGGLAALGGGALSTVGWYVFAKNRNWLDRPEAEQVHAKTAPTVTVAVSPLPGGAALAGSVSF
jgi:hypothetical protein